MSDLIAADRLTFHYHGAPRPVLQGWSGGFAAQTMTAIMGPSGAGKSSLMFLLGLMLRAEEGEVLVDGRRVDSLSDAARSRLRASRFGFIFQDSALDARRSILDNVIQTAVFRGERRNRWEASARQLLEELGVTVPVSRRPGQVSGGQAQRIAMCRALLHGPDIILADEPTGNLDAASTEVVMSELRRRSDAGAAVIIVTHGNEVAARCDRVIELTPLGAG